MLVLQHLLPVRKAHVRIMHRPLRHVRQHRLRRRRVRNPGRRMGVRRMRTETRPGEKRLFDALENYEGTEQYETAETIHRIIRGFIDSL